MTVELPLPPAPLPDGLVALAAQYADGEQSPVAPRDAATVVLMRPTVDRGPEVYYMHRRASMAFAAGKTVFLGGGVDSRDADRELVWSGPSPAAWSERLGCEEGEARALVCAAVREIFEESGVLLAGPSADEVVADTTSEDWEADRVALETRSLSMADVLGRRGLVLRTDLLGAWDAWLTPAFFPKRYRTWFFVALLPEGQAARDVSSESSSVDWLPARVAVDRAEAGQLAMMPPTYLISMEVGSFDTPEAVLAEAATRSVSMFMEQVERSGDRHHLSYPDRLRPLVAARHR